MKIGTASTMEDNFPSREGQTDASAVVPMQHPRKKGAKTFLAKLKTKTK